MKHIVLTGFMGVGKTTLGKQLASHFNRPFIDIDDEICKGEHATIHALITDSESYFRALEYNYVKKALKHSTPSIIALGGGAFCQENTYNLIAGADAISIYISMLDETCFKQLEHIKASRPLLSVMDGEQWKQQALNLYNLRRPLYERANIQMRREGLTLNKCLDDLEKHYGKIY